jgi:hypothetical protein
MVSQTYKFPTKTLAKFAVSEMKKAGLTVLSESSLYVEVRGLLSDKAVSLYIEQNRGRLVMESTDSDALTAIESRPKATQISEAKMFPRFKKSKKLNEQGHQVAEAMNKALDKIEGYMMDGLSKREAYKMWSKTSGLAVELKQQVGHQIGLDEVAPPTKKKSDAPAPKSDKGIESAAMTAFKAKVESDPKKFPKLAAALGVGKKGAKKESVNESVQLDEAGIKDKVMSLLTTSTIAKKFKDAVAAKNTASFDAKVSLLAADVIAALYKMSGVTMAVMSFLDKTKAEKTIQELIKKVASSDAGVAATNHLAHAVSSLIMGYEPEGEVVTEAFRMQDWERMSKQHKSPTPVRIITKDRKVYDGRLEKIQKYDLGYARKGFHIVLHPPKQGMPRTMIDDVDVMNIYFGDEAIRQRVNDKKIKTQKSKLPAPPRAESVEVDEVAPPSGVGRKIAKKQSSKLAFSKTYGPEKGKQVRYATAWKAYNKGK